MKLRARLVTLVGYLDERLPGPARQARDPPLDAVGERPRPLDVALVKLEARREELRGPLDGRPVERLAESGDV